MKKLLIAASILVTCFSSAFASETIMMDSGKNTLFFKPEAYLSKNTSEVINIQSGGGTHTLSISVDGAISNRTGVNVTGCGKVTHINAGSSAVCPLEYATPVISFACDKNDKSFYASGHYQIH